MGAALQYRFYHLSATPLVKALGELATKAVSQDRKILVAVPEGKEQALDDGLWTYKQDNFLAHGITGDPSPEKTPVWISARPADWQTPPNGADTLIITEGVEASGDYALICDMFDGADAEQLASARARWQKIKESGLTPSYFQQTATGGWEQKQ